MINSAIADIIGSAYEGRELKGFNLPLMTPDSKFTDDTVLMVATADLLLKTKDAGKPLIELTAKDFALAYKEWGREFPTAEYSPSFKEWLNSDSLEPVYSVGSGVTSRVFPIAWIADSEKEMMQTAVRSSMATHESPEADVAAASIAYTIYHLLNGKTLDELKSDIETKFFYPMNQDWEALHAADSFSTHAEDVAGLGLAVGLTAKSHEDAMRLVLYVGGDTDTVGAVAMSIMDARIPGGGFGKIEGKCRSMIEKAGGERLLTVIDAFDGRFLSTQKSEIN